MRKGRFLSAVLAGLMAGCAVTATLAQEVHYSPEERPDAIDAALIATANARLTSRPTPSRIPSFSMRSTRPSAAALLSGLSSIRANVMTSSSSATYPITLGSSAADRSCI